MYLYEALGLLRGTVNPIRGGNLKNGELGPLSVAVDGRGREMC